MCLRLGLGAGKCIMQISVLNKMEVQENMCLLVSVTFI